ncbi:protein YIPF6-like [Dysidea avara]|uniref:protein YIPF6-like n=1 Tax=Dysidea avara TaxID=196820 RepID=UPI00332DADB4
MDDIPLDDIAGDINVPQDEDALGTLDEPVSTTLKRDLKAIFDKCRHVIIPGRSKALLHDWDLWGPLFLCIILAMLLPSNTSDTSGLHFIQVFVVVWGGSCLVTVNAQLLRAKLSFFQSVCTLGYCLLPLTLSLVISRVILLTSNGHMMIFLVRLILIMSALAWSLWASTGFLTDYLPSEKKILAMYPIFLFYFGISCLILAQNN